jgi:hypothetical protein
MLTLNRRTLIATAAAWTGTRAVAQAEPGAVSILRYLPESEHALIASKRSEFDCSVAILSALGEVAGALYFPAGRYRIAKPIRWTPPRFTGRFAPGPHFVGDGPGRTVFANGVADAAMFDFDSGATPATGFQAIRDLRLTGFTIEGERHGLDAIRLRGLYQSAIERVQIVGHRGDGVRVPCLYGDIDGSNMLTLRQVMVEDCSRWGIDTSAAPGNNENSFFNFEQVFVQACGTPATAARPAGGGIRHKGQVMTLRQSGLTANANVGLYLPGEPGLGLTATIEDVAFENNHGRHMLCTGYHGVIARNIQLYSNDTHRVQVAVEFDGARDSVRGVEIDGVTVRATAANAPYTAFRFTGGELDTASCHVRNVIWRDADHPGQNRIDGKVALTG